MAHARSLSKLADQEKQIELAHKIVSEGMNVRILEKLISDDTFEKKVKIKRSCLVILNNFFFLDKMKL